MAELREESFWKASVALQSNRLDDSYRFLSQAIEQLDQPYLTLEQVDLVWTVISSRLIRRASSKS